MCVCYRVKGQRSQWKTMINGGLSESCFSLEFCCGRSEAAHYSAPKPYRGTENQKNESFEKRFFGAPSTRRAQICTRIVLESYWLAKNA